MRGWRWRRGWRRGERGVNFEPIPEGNSRAARGNCSRICEGVREGRGGVGRETGWVVIAKCSEWRRCAQRCVRHDGVAAGGLTRAPPTAHATSVQGAQVLVQVDAVWRRRCVRLCARLCTRVLPSSEPVARPPTPVHSPALPTPFPHLLPRLLSTPPSNNPLKDTLFFLDGVKDVLRDYDPELPYVITGEPGPCPVMVIVKAACAGCRRQAAAYPSTQSDPDPGHQHIPYRTVRALFNVCLIILFPCHTIARRLVLAPRQAIHAGGPALPALPRHPGLPRLGRRPTRPPRAPPEAGPDPRHVCGAARAARGLPLHPRPGVCLHAQRQHGDIR